MITLKKLGWVFVVAVLASPAVAVPRQTSNEKLVLDKTQGKAPLSVSMIAPDELAKRWTDWQRKGCRHSKWGDGFSIDWGDGSGEGDADAIAGRSAPFTKTVDPADIGRHTFAGPGTYTVSAQMYEHLPTDGAQVFWRGQTTVTVEAK